MSLVPLSGLELASRPVGETRLKVHGRNDFRCSQSVNHLHSPTVLSILRTMTQGYPDSSVANSALWLTDDDDGAHRERHGGRPSNGLPAAAGVESAADGVPIIDWGPDGSTPDQTTRQCVRDARAPAGIGTWTEQCFSQTSCVTEAGRPQSRWQRRTAVAPERRQAFLRTVQEERPRVLEEPQEACPLLVPGPGPRRHSTLRISSFYSASPDAKA